MQASANRQGNVFVGAKAIHQPFKEILAARTVRVDADQVEPQHDAAVIIECVPFAHAFGLVVGIGRFRRTPLWILATSLFELELASVGMAQLHLVGVIAGASFDAQLGVD